MTIVSKPCVDCGITITGAPQKRRCAGCRKIRGTTVIRTLAAGEKVPPHEPRRYPSSHGYVRLRWRVGTKECVETYEHRIFDGRVTDAEHVHHINHVKTDNRDANLERLTAESHSVKHALESVSWWHEAANLYRIGFSTYEIGKRLNRNPSTVYRALVRLGVETRSDERIAVPHGTKRKRGGS
ncbi:hypothetical protein E7939_21780 [Salmonella enterica]|nr:hypothetical protein [Salmonella enterica]